MKDRLSVIIPVYNSENTLERCILSILDQTYKNIEIILINDGSIDNSLRIMEKYQKIDNRVKIYSNSNHGVGYTRNYGIERATGEYITFVDSDDYIEKNMYLDMINMLKKEKCDMIICSYNKIIDEKIIKNKYVPEMNKIIGIDSVLTYLKNEKYNYVANVWNKIYVKDKIKKEFSEDYFIGEDLLFNCYYIVENENVFFLNKEYYNYVIEQTSLSNRVSNKTVTAIYSYNEIIDLLRNKISKLNLDDMYREQFRFANLILKKYKKLACKEKKYIKKLRINLFMLLMKSDNINFKRKIKTILKLIIFK